MKDFVKLELGFYERDIEYSDNLHLEDLVKDYMYEESDFNQEFGVMMSLPPSMSEVEIIASILEYNLGKQNDIVNIFKNNKVETLDEMKSTLWNLNLDLYYKFIEYCYSNLDQRPSLQIILENQMGSLSQEQHKQFEEWRDSAQLGHWDDILYTEFNLIRNRDGDTYSLCHLGYPEQGYLYLSSIIFEKLASWFDIRKISEIYFQNLFIMHEINANTFLPIKQNLRVIEFHHCNLPALPKSLFVDLSLTNLKLQSNVYREGTR